MQFLAVLQRQRRPSADARRSQTLGGAVHGRELGRHRRWFLLVQAVLRMHHFQPHRAAAHLAEAAHPEPRAQRLALARREVEEPCRERAAPVADARRQRTPPAVCELRLEHLPGDQTLLARREFVEGHGARAVLVAKGQVQDQIADGGEAEAGELFRTPGADARQHRERFVEPPAHADCGCRLVGHVKAPRRARSARAHDGDPCGRRASALGWNAAFSCVQGRCEGKHRCDAS